MIAFHPRTSSFLSTTPQTSPAVRRWSWLIVQVDDSRAPADAGVLLQPHIGSFNGRENHDSQGVVLLKDVHQISIVSIHQNDSAHLSLLLGLRGCGEHAFCQSLAFIPFLLVDRCSIAIGGR